MPDVVILAPFGLRPKATLSRRALPLCASLAARGWRIHILAPPDLWPDDAGLVTQIHGVTIEHGPLFHGPAPLKMLRASQWMYRRTLELRPRLVHLFKPKGYGAIAAELLRRTHPQIPVLLDTDDWEGRGGWNDRLPYSAPIKALINVLERHLPRITDGVTVASRTLEQQVRGFGASQVLYLPNGVALPGRRLPERRIARGVLGLDSRPTVLLYTRFWEFQVRDVVTCLIGLNAQIPEIRLLVIGSGEQGEEHELGRLAQRAGVAHALDQRGWADEQTIAAALAAADVALYPMDDTLLNRSKCSAKLTEQMQAGLPIVAAHVGQVAEYIDSESGVLVRPGDGGALAQGVLALLQHPTQAQRIGEAAQQRIESLFNWNRLADPLAALWETRSLKRY